MLILHKVLCIFPAIPIPRTEQLLVFSTGCWHQESNPGVMGMSPNTMPCSYSAPGIQFYVIQSALTRRSSKTLSKVLRTQQIKMLSLQPLSARLWHISYWICFPAPVQRNNYWMLGMNHGSNSTASIITRCFTFQLCSPIQNFQHVLMAVNLSSQHPNTVSQDCVRAKPNSPRIIFSLICPISSLKWFELLQEWLTHPSEVDIGVSFTMLKEHHTSHNFWLLYTIETKAALFL